MLGKIKPKSEFFRNVLTLMTGTTIAQAIPIAISPILTRIYSPEEFGLFALYMAITVVVAVIATGRYELAIMLPKNNRDAQILVVLSVIIALFISFILCVIVFFLNEPITKLLNNPEIGGWLYFIPLSVLFTGFYQSFNYWNNRNKKYKLLAKSRVIQSGSVASTQIISGINGFGGGGLITGHVIGQGIVSVFLGKQFFYHSNFSFKKIKLFRSFILMKRYKKFPLINVWSGVLNSASVHLPVVFLSIFFNASVTGFFSLSQRIILMPMTLIGTSIGQVYYQQASMLKNNTEEIKKITLNLYKKLLMIGVFPIIIIIMFGETMFSFAFGERWYEAGIYAKYLSLWVFFVFASSPLSHLMNVYEKHTQSLYFNSILFFSRVSIIYLGAVFYHNALDTILLYGVVGAFLWGGFSLYLMKLAGVKYSETIKCTVPYLIIFFISYAISFYY